MASARVYVYGLVRGGSRMPDGLSGVGRPALPARLVPVGAVSAVVSDVPDDLRARRRDLLAHQQLILDVGLGGPILPMRFGTVADDEEAVRRTVGQAARVHLAALERLGGRWEMNVKMFPDEGGLEALVRHDATLLRLTTQVRRRPSYEANVRLGQAVSEALHHRAAAAAQEAVAELTALAEESVPGPEVHGCVRNTSFLVPEASLAGFRVAAEKVARRSRTHMEMRMTGPLPCYSFVPREPAVRSANDARFAGAGS
jgi:gas vesicle protein GvpL/GvpF